MKIIHCRDGAVFLFKTAKNRFSKRMFRVLFCSGTEAVNIFTGVAWMSAAGGNYLWSAAG